MKNIGIDNYYNIYPKSKDITHKIVTKRHEFDAEVWISLPRAIQLDRMVRLTTNLLVIDVDVWADKIMLARRNKRKFINPREKTESMWNDR